MSETHTVVSEHICLIPVIVWMTRTRFAPALVADIASESHSRMALQISLRLIASNKMFDFLGMHPSGCTFLQI